MPAGPGAGGAQRVGPRPGRHGEGHGGGHVRRPAALADGETGVGDQLSGQVRGRSG